MVHDSIAELERTGRELQEECRARLGETMAVFRQGEPHGSQCLAQGISPRHGDEVEVVRLVLVVGVHADGAATRQRSLDPRGLQCLAYQRGKLDRGRVRCGFPVRRGRCRCWKYASVTSLGRRASSVSRNTRRSLDRGTGRIPRELAQAADLRAHQHASIPQPAELTLDRHVRQVECRGDAPGVALAIVLQEQQDLRRRMDTSCGRSYLFGAICGSTGRSGLGGWLD